MKWITRCRVKVDRVACPWLIRKFVAPNAEFVSLPPDTDWADIKADSHPSNPHPAGEVLRWVAHGFSAFGLSDDEILGCESALYDALYAECQRRVS